MGATIFGDRLRQARILRQRKLADLAELLSCSVPTMSKWERARIVDVSPLQLSVLAENLKFSPGFFSARPSPPLFDNDLLFKAPKSTPKREIDWLREFVRLTSELLDWLDERQPLPPVKLKLRSSDSGNIPEAARELRDRLGLSATTPIDFLTHPVERAGAIVVVRRRGYIEAGEWSRPTATSYPPHPHGAGARASNHERHEGCSAWVGEFRERPLVLMRE